ncbi:MAG TPA: hypothetical protein VGR28_05995 [Candidatus Thermoplasmatota archaeon]|jgi:hypothetical protein|nr:hypothetical protein [Candidatus Thermoplasmatota archaeon]
MAGPTPAQRLRDEEVVAAITVVFSRFEKVETQHRLKDLVTKELARRRPGAKVAGARVRLLAIRSGLVRMETRTREGDGIEGLEACPVCAAKLRRVRNRTLTGGQVLVGLKCPVCGYKTGRVLEVPSRYVFHRR